MVFLIRAEEPVGNRMGCEGVAGSIGGWPRVDDW